MPGRKVEIVVTSTVVGQYEARSYPDSQIDATGAYSLYRVPVYRIQIKGTDVRGLAKTVDFMAPRFMPYYNDPQRPYPHYSARGWVNAGLSAARTVVVSTYKRDYEVRNRYSQGEAQSSSMPRSMCMPVLRRCRMSVSDQRAASRSSATMTTSRRRSPICRGSPVRSMPRSSSW